MMVNTMTGPEPVVRVILGGDVMLGRNVKQAILRFGVDYPLGPVASLMQRTELTIVNLECAITATERFWPGAPKAFYFGAPPWTGQPGEQPRTRLWRRRLIANPGPFAATRHSIRRRGRRT